MFSASVIICAHNPRQDYLAHVLDALRRQTLPLPQWELLLVDNGSDVPLAPEWDLAWHPHARHIRENELGLTTARLCGIRAATANLLVFVDDDNILDPRYLEIALDLAADWPKIGVFGGSQIAQYEQEPNDEIRDFAHLLAVRTIRQVLWTNVKGIDEATPRGAGMCLRRPLALRYMELVESNRLRKTLDRSGQDGLLSGGDTDMVWCVCDFGYGMLVTPALTLTHQIDKKRLDPSYLIKIVEGYGASNIVLTQIHNLPKSKSTLIDNARDLLRILQSNGLVGKRITIADLRGRWRGGEILRRNKELSLPAPGESPQE
jgi:glycosyltransferase involved in cell wall biosynthesis